MSSDLRNSPGFPLGEVWQGEFTALDPCLMAHRTGFEPATPLGNQGESLATLPIRLPVHGTEGRNRTRVHKGQNLATVPALFLRMVVLPGLEPEIPRYEQGVMASFTTEPWWRRQDLNLRPSAYEADEHNRAALLRYDLC